jgi:hypothetical protein
MRRRDKGFVLCIANRGAEDLEVRKVYRVLPDKAATATGYLRVIDESGEDYLYPAGFFVAVEVPHKARRALAVASRPAKRRISPNKPLQRAGARAARSGR